MGLTVINNAKAGDVASLLRKICPDPTLTIDVGIFTQPDPTDPNNPIILLRSGKVSYTAGPGANKSCMRLSKLANSSQEITIEMVPAGTTVQNGLSVEAVDDHGGITKDTLDHFLYKDIGVIEISIDDSNADGGGYWVFDSTGKKHIDEPLDAILAHELGHAEAYMDSALGGAGEVNPLKAENEYRAEHGLPPRSSDVQALGGRNVPKPPPPPPPKKPATTTPPRPVGCFVATAAFGSPLAPEVELLRSLRDNVLRQTRAGSAFYEWFYERYYRFSPAIVEMMAADPEVRDMVRWVAVTPIVQYLRAFTRFPQTSLAEVPEPWRTFLSELDAGFQDFASTIPPETSFLDLSPEDAVLELGVLLRYRFRTSEARRGYLSELCARGALPLAVRDSEQRARLQATLCLLGIDLELGALILSAQAVPPRRTELGGAFGVHNITGSPPDFMYVGLSNTSQETVDDVTLAFKRFDMAHSGLITRGPLLPQSTVYFCLGRAEKVQRFAFAGYEGQTKVLEMSGYDVSDSFIQDHKTAPNVFEFFFDGQPIM